MTLSLVIILAIIFGICVTILCYVIPNKFGYKKTGIALSCIIGFFVIYLPIAIIFEDELFSKGNAADLLRVQDIYLKENFEILKNETVFSPGDYRHNFTLEISSRDKKDIIEKIKSANNFMQKEDSVPSIFGLTDWHHGKMITQNYETNSQFVRRFLKPIGDGYRPTYNSISIDKGKNILMFEGR